MRLHTRAAVRRRGHGRRLRVDIHRQPDPTTCGPTCLHAVYRFYGDDVALDRVVAEVTPLDTGGTLAVLLGTHALRRGYRATIYTYNLQLFDPTWFARRGVDIAERLRRQMRAKQGRKLHVAGRAFLDYFRRGGEVRFEELTPRVLRRHLGRGTPVLAGLSATYLYGCARETDDRPDDIAGRPVGHFVVLCGYQPRRRRVLVADPMHDNPRFGSRHYAVGIDRLVGAILLGIVTYDANLLVIEPGRAG